MKASIGWLTTTGSSEIIAKPQSRRSSEMLSSPDFTLLALLLGRRTEVRVEFLIDKTKLLDRLRGHLNERQEKALLRILREGPEGFKGGLSAGNYASITRASPA